jgi:stage V sporulation protein S
METVNNEPGHIDTIKVAANSRTSAVAGAIAGVFRENQRAEVQAIGASAVNQAVKALALAKGYLVEDGYDIVCIPFFVDVEIDGKVRTAIRFIVEPH